MSYPDADRPRGRHRARHADAAPDAYPDRAHPDHAYPDRSGPGDDAWWRQPDPDERDEPRRYGDGVSAYPLFASDEPPPIDWDERDRPRSRRRKPPKPQPAAQPEPEPGDEPAAEPPASSGRAGRNLPAAIAVGASLGAAVLASLFLWRPAFLGVVVAAVGVGTWEMVRAVRASGAQPPLVPLLVGGAVMSCLAWFSGPAALALGLLLTVLTTMVWRLADGPAGYHRDTAAAVLVAIYVPFLAGFAALLGAPDDGHWRVLVTLAAVVLCDTGGYAAGVFFGKRPMAPSVSPKKSWEGFAGSLAATAIGSAVLLYLLLDVAPWWGLVFGIAVSAAAVLGDLAESLLKRDLGIKDMGTLLPGHGGLMDRLDSILFAAPAAYLLLSVLAPVTA